MMKIVPCLILSDVWALENAAKLMMELRIEWNNVATVDDCDVFPFSGGRKKLKNIPNRPITVNKLIKYVCRV